MEKKHVGRGRVRQWIGFAVMVIGLCLLCGPYILGMITGARQESLVSDIENAIDEASGDGGGIQVNDSKESAEPQDSFYRAALEYNRQLVRKGQDGMNTSSAVETFALDARDYGYPENAIGTIEIPRLDVKLGLYLGANYDGMDKGAAIFGMTSLPLGNEDENTAIAGHRGWRGTPVFRDIQLIQLGDPIYITTPWRTLVYRVTELEIVTPDDNTWCKIQKGRTLITLMTCHPYGNNYQRYIVYAELTDETRPDDDEVERQNAESFDDGARSVTQRNADGTEQTVSVSPESIEPDGSEYGAYMSNLVIFAEDKMRPVAAVSAVLVLLTGVYLTVVTVRDNKRKQKESGIECQDSETHDDGR